MQFWGASCVPSPWCSRKNQIQRAEKRGRGSSFSSALRMDPLTPLALTLKKTEAGGRAGWAYSPPTTTLPPPSAPPCAQRLTSRDCAFWLLCFLASREWGSVQWEAPPWEKKAGEQSWRNFSTPPCVDSLELPQQITRDLDGLKQWNVSVTVLENGSLKSRCRQGWLPLEAQGRTCSLFLS